MPHESSVPASRPLSLLQRFVGVVVSPGDTMASVAAYPAWLGMLALITVLMAIGQGLFFSTAVGEVAALDQSVASVEAFGVTVTDAMYRGMEQQAKIAKYVNPGVIVIFGPVITAVIAAVLFGLFTVLGGEGTFRQVFAVVTHTSVVSLLQQVFTLPLNYARESMSSATNLAIFFPGLSDGSFLASLLGFIDLFWVWYLVVLAIGLGAVYRRRWAPISVGLFGVYFLLGVGFAAFKAAMGGR